VDFYVSCISEKRNECSTEELQNLQLYLWLTVSLQYLMQPKTHKTAHFELNCHGILLLNSKNECFYKLLLKSFSSLLVQNLLHYNSLQVYGQNDNFIFKNHNISLKIK